MKKDNKLLISKLQGWEAKITPKTFTENVRAYQKWNTKELQDLILAILNGSTIEDLCNKHARTEIAILSKVHKYSYFYSLRQLIPNIDHRESCIVLKRFYWRYQNRTKSKYKNNNVPFSLQEMADLIKEIKQNSSFEKLVTKFDRHPKRILTHIQYLYSYDNAITTFEYQDYKQKFKEYCTNMKIKKEQQLNPKCDDCITPVGTRCESEPSTCPYHQKNNVLDDISEINEINTKKCDIDKNE